MAAASGAAACLHTAPIGIWCEAGLGICVLLLPPLLVLVPHGVAPLAAVAGLCAAGLVAGNRPYALQALRRPAAILGALLLWGALSAIWSIDPSRSLVLEARLAGLFAIGLALAAAAGLVAAPRRVALLLFTGIAVGIVLTGYDFASGGGLSSHISIRAFRPARLNQIAVGLAIVWLPASALLVQRGRLALGLAAAAAMAATVCLLEGTAAKTALAMSLPMAALLYRWRGPVARAAALISVLGILTAPLTLPALDRLPGLLMAADAFKDSAGHRLLIWSFVGERIAERPFAGWGLDAARAIPGGGDEVRPGENSLPLHPHDAALQLWLELGLPGAALFALFVTDLWLRLAALPWPRLYAAAAGGGLTAALAVAFAAYGIWQEWWLGTLGLALFAIIVMARAATPSAPGRSPGDRSPGDRSPGATRLPRRGWRASGR